LLLRSLHGRRLVFGFAILRLLRAKDFVAAIADHDLELLSTDAQPGVTDGVEIGSCLQRCSSRNETGVDTVLRIRRSGDERWLLPSVVATVFHRLHGVRTHSSRIDGGWSWESFRRTGLIGNFLGRALGFWHV
jgi:hypothetical protein